MKTFCIICTKVLYKKKKSNAKRKHIFYFSYTFLIFNRRYNDVDFINFEYGKCYLCVLNASKMVVKI